MKKLTISTLALLALTLTGCEKDQTRNYDEDKAPASHITEFTHKGHNYLLYQRWSGLAYGVAGITHDPDCPCREKGDKDATD